MDKRAFKKGDFYRVCARCGEWVPAKAQRCDSCNELLQMADFYEVTEEDISQEIQKQDGLVLRCYSCNAIYAWGQYTACPSCNEVLMPEPGTVSEEAMLQNAAPETIPDTMKDTDDVVKYCYTVYRYSHGKEVPARRQRIPFEEKETGFGRRNFTSDPRLFFDNRTEKIDRFYSTISTDNAVIRQADGKLILEHIAGKSPIRLNGIMLRSGERKELHDGDLIRFGQGSDKEHMIDVHIHKVKPLAEANYSNEQRWEQMMQEIKTIKASAEATAMRLDNIEKAIENIRPEDLIIGSDEKPEEFDKRIDEMIPVLSPLTMEEEIVHFLQIQCGNGTVQDCREQLNAIKERKQMVSYLYQAAFLEKACKAMPEEIRDYSAALNSIGRAFEEFICTEVLSLVYKTNANDFQTYIHNNNLKEDSLQQGRILNYLLWRGRAVMNQPWSCEGDVRIYNIVKAAGYNDSNNTYFWECRDAIQNVKYATGCRNHASHAHAAGDTSKENLEKYIKQNVHAALSEKDYLQQKEQIFTTKALSILHRYYIRACKNENC